MSTMSTVGLGVTVGDAALRAPKLTPASAVAADVRALLADAHVHAAVVVDDEGRLLTVVVRDDLRDVDGHDVPDDAPAAALGTLTGRVVDAATPLADARALLLATGQRRLAVTRDGVLLGLLCLKRSGRGFCSADDVRARERERAARG